MDKIVENLEIKKVLDSTYKEVNDTIKEYLLGSITEQFPSYEEKEKYYALLQKELDKEASTLAKEEEKLDERVSSYLKEIITDFTTPRKAYCVYLDKIEEIKCPKCSEKYRTKEIKDEEGNVYTVACDCRFKYSKVFKYKEILMQLDALTHYGKLYKYFDDEDNIIYEDDLSLSKKEITDYTDDYRLTTSRCYYGSSKEWADKLCDHLNEHNQKQVNYHFQ